MESKYYRSWHLAKNPTEFKVTEFEYVLARVFEAFARWVTAAGDILVNSDIKFSEHLILHVIRMQNRPKSGTTIARMINRDVLVPRGALIGFNPEEDRRRHTVTDGGVVVVTADDEPLIGTISESALQAEFEADRVGTLI